MANIQRLKAVGGEHNYVVDPETGKVQSIGRGFGLLDSFESLESSGTLMQQNFKYKPEQAYESNNTEKFVKTGQHVDDSFDVPKPPNLH